MVVRLTEENAALRRAQVEWPARPEIRQVAEVNYYFLGEEGPFCQPCYDRTGKLVNLTPRQKFAGGTGRKCLVCTHLFVEEVTPAPRMALQRRPYTRR